MVQDTMDEGLGYGYRRRGWQGLYHHFSVSSYLALYVTN